MAPELSNAPHRSRIARAGSAVSGWFLPELPYARIAMIRAIIYPFLIIDMLYIAFDTIFHGYVPELHAPTFIARLLHLPPLSVLQAQILFWVITVFAVLAACGVWQRVSGWVAGLGFWLWMLTSLGFGYVSHDHMALMIALLVLPTVGVVKFTDPRSGAAAGWALRVMQIFTVLTYFGSVFPKWIRSGSPFTWANSAVFTWAIMRRGSDLIRWTLDYRWLLQIAQWGILLIEILSPVVLFLRGKALYIAVGLFLSFHLATYLALGIHFLPTIVCWSAFLPLEKLPKWVLAKFGRARTA